MNNIIKILNIFVLVFACLAVVLGSPERGRILNGINAKETQCPSQVRLEIRRNINKTRFCGGSVLAHNWVLTAAHCVDDVKDVTIFLGSIRRNEKYKVLYASPNDVIVHAKYKTIVYENDIALIRTPYIEFDERIKPVTLPKLTAPEDVDLYENSYVTICGWGKTHFSLFPMDLQFTTMQVISNKKCKELHKNDFSKLIAESNLCANGADGNNTRTCTGDSGSPMILRDANAERLQIGISSFGSNEGCEKNLPRVYTRITSHLEWIKEKMQEKI